MNYSRRKKPIIGWLIFGAVAYVSGDIFIGIWPDAWPLWLYCMTVCLASALIAGFRVIDLVAGEED